MNFPMLKDRLIWGEGWRNKPYEDTTGHVSIGVGRNLDDIGLSDEEINFLLQNDMLRCVRDARSFDYWSVLSDVRRAVVADCTFNMGLAAFRAFKKTHQAIRDEDWAEAARQLLDSKYARQTGRRARANAFALEHDRFPTDSELWLIMEDD